MVSSELHPSGNDFLLSPGFHRLYELAAEPSVRLHLPTMVLPACLPQVPHDGTMVCSGSYMSYTHSPQERKEQFLLLIDSTIILFHYNVAPTLILSPVVPRCESTLDSRRLCGKACPSVISTHQLGNQRSQHSTTTTVQPATLPPMA